MIHWLYDQAETAVTPSGMAESDSTNTYLRLTGSPDTLANISNIPIQANDRTFRLGDIAETNAAMLNRLNRKCTLMVSQP